MTHKLYQALDWDTQQLGVKAAKLIPSSLTATALTAALSELKEAGTQLVFWCCDANSENHEAATQAGGLLTDDKLTYLQPLESINAENFPKQVAYYPASEPDQSLLTLAYAVCDESRFSHDPHLSKAQAYQVYKEWMRNSTLHHNASDVLVIPGKNGFDGMVTLGEKNQRGDIGLLAVAEHARGKGFGKILVQAALCYFKQKGFSYSQVVTQETNPGACKLYKSCGYHLEKKEYFFHFWI